MTNSTVIFNPVVGKDYKTKGREYLGRRVMVLGASNYCEHFDPAIGCGPSCKKYGKYHLVAEGPSGRCEEYFGRRCECFTEIVYERYRRRLRVSGLRNDWMRTFFRFYNAFFVGGNPSDAVRCQLLDHLVCTEYVQGAEAGGWSVNSAEAMASDRNFKELVKEVKDLEPDVIIVWGPRVWNEICRQAGFSEHASVMLDMVLGGHRVKMLRVPHPSSYGKNGFRREAFQGLLEKCGVRLLSVSRQVNKHER